MKNIFVILLMGGFLFTACSPKSELGEVARPVEEVVELLPTIPGAGDIISVVADKSYTVEQVEEEIIPFFDGKFDYPPMMYGVNSYRIKYMSTDFDGTPAVIYAQLFIPQTETPQELPVYVFGSGTTGITDRAAPSLEVPETLRWGWYRNNMLAYGGSGYITIFPDYLGFNDLQVEQRYFSKEAEAHVMLDAIRTLDNLYKAPQSPLTAEMATPSGKSFVAGYSQGGHAAFAAADLNSSYAPDVEVTGVIGYASTNNIAALFREGVCYGAEIIYSYGEMYGWDKIDPSLYINEPYLPTFKEDASSMSVDVFQYYFSYNGKKLFAPAFYDALHGETLERDFPEINKYFKMNDSGLDGHGVPAFVVQGGTDFIITTASQDIFVEKLKAQGSEVKYTVYDGVSHKYSRMAGFSDSLEWMATYGQ